MGPTLTKDDFGAWAAYRAAHKGLRKGKKGKTGEVRKGGDGKLTKITRGRARVIGATCVKDCATFRRVSPIRLALVRGRLPLRRWLVCPPDVLSRPRSLKNSLFLCWNRRRNWQKGMSRKGAPFSTSADHFAGFPGSGKESVVTLDPGATATVACSKCLKHRDVLPRDGEVQIR